MSYLALPFGIAFNNFGLIASGAKLYAYLTGTSTPTPLYADEGLTTPLSNPVIANAVGRFPDMFMDDDVVYRLRLETALGALIDEADPISSPLGVLGGPTGATFVGFQQTNSSLLRTVNAKLLEAAVTPEDFGAVGDGVTNDRSAIQAAIDAAGTRPVWIAKDHLVDGLIELPSNVTIVGTTESARIRSTEPSASLLRAKNVSNVRISGLSLGYTVGSGDAYTGCVTFDAASDGLVQDCDCDGLPWAGVYISGSSKVRVSRCNFANSLCTADNTSAVGIFDGSNDNVVEDCDDESECWVSYFIQDTSNGSTPCFRNKIQRNKSRSATVYGAIIYLSRPGIPTNSYNEILFNDIGNVTDADYGSGGSAIYVVGHAAGGAKVIGNTCRNACQQTEDRANAPAGISISNIPEGCDPVIISDNIVSEMVQGDGISVTAAPGGCIIGPNTVNLPSTNNGTGPGGAALQGVALRVENSRNVSVTGGRYNNDGTGQAIAVRATSINVDRVTFNGIQASCSSSAGAAVYHFSGENDGVTQWLITNVAINGGTAITSGTGNTIQMAFAEAGAVTGIAATAGTGAMVSLSSVTNMLFSAGKYFGTGAYGVALSGDCTGTVFDASNSNNRLFSNGSTGGRVEFDVLSIPIAGDFRIGDKAYNNAAVIGQPLGWTCTAAGSPGTFTPWANL